MRRLFFGIALAAVMLGLWDWDAGVVAAPTPPAATDTETAAKLDRLQWRLDELERKEQKVQDVRETDQRQFYEIRERDRKDTEKRLREFEDMLMQDVDRETQKAKELVEYGNKKVEWWLILSGIAVSVSALFGLLMTVIIDYRMKQSGKSQSEANKTLNNIKIIEKEIINTKRSLIAPAINYNLADKIDKTTLASAQIASSQDSDTYSKFVGEALLATEKKDYHSSLKAWEKAKEIRKTNLAFYGVGINKYRIAKTEEDPVKKKKLLNESIDNFKKLLVIDQTKSYFAYNQWGNSLVELSSVESDKKKIIELLDSAIDKYSRALKHEQNENELYNNYGNALLLKAKNTDAQEEKKQLIHTARNLFLKAESLLTGSASYNIACAYILEGMIDEAKTWLHNAKETFFLPDCDHLRTDTDLDPVRNEQWFKDFLAEACPEE